MTHSANVDSQSPQSALHQTEPEKKILPFSLISGRKLGRRSRKAPLFGLMLGIAVILSGCVRNSTPKIVVCSKNFTEQLILGELLAQHIEKQLNNVQVERRFNLAGELCHQALVAGQVDLYVEYTGTAFTNILKQKPISDAQVVFNQVKQNYAQQYSLDWMPPFGFNNTFAMVVRSEDAQQLKLNKISDLATQNSQLKAGFGYEFVEREDGFPGLAKTYNLKLAEPPKTMDLSLIYQALVEKQVDVVAGNSTDALIDVLNLVVLEDDKNYFPPYEAAPVVRQETLNQHPQLKSILQQLQGKISEEKMRKLNYEVDGQKRDYAEVVQEFIQSNPL